MVPPPRLERGTSRSTISGTSDDYRDAWFVGYTPELVVGVWVGFDDGRSLRASGARAALPIFSEFLIGALGEEGGSEFLRPAGVERVRVVARAGHRAGVRCGGEPEYFLEGSAPVESCGLFERVFGRFWRIAHAANSSPLGPRGERRLRRPHRGSRSPACEGLQAFA